MRKGQKKRVWTPEQKSEIVHKHFGTLKSECLHRMKFSNRAEVEQAVAEYVQFYNFERINLKDGLTPYEIRSKAA